MLSLDIKDVPAVRNRPPMQALVDKIITFVQEIARDWMERFPA